MYRAADPRRLVLLPLQKADKAMSRPPDHDPGYENRKREQTQKEKRETCRYCKAKEQTGQTCEKCGAPMKREG